MNIGKLGERVEIQRQQTVTDEIGNHRNVWTDYYRCSAFVTTAVGESDKESEQTAQTVEHPNIVFTVRASEKSEKITENGFRVLFRGEVYNIVGIDRMNYNRKSVKLRCRKEAR